MRCTLLVIALTSLGCLEPWRAPPDAGSPADAANRGPCTSERDCPSRELSRCGADGFCAVCETSAECDQFGKTPVCVAGQGCFACGPDDAFKCAPPRSVCSSEFTCVECTAEDSTTCDGTQVPFCELSSGRCVACRNSDDCGDIGRAECTDRVCKPCTSDEACAHFEDTKHCDTATQKCVGCRNDNDCGVDAPVCDTATGRCGGCTEGAQCARFADASVCDDSVCVECTAAQDQACQNAPGGPFVCSAITHACSDQAPRSADACDECVSDAQCKVGQVCASDGMSGDSWACQWVKGGGDAAPVACTASARPFVKNAEATSIDGQSVALCALATSSCSAHRAFRSSCGRFDAGNDSIIVESRFDERIPGGPVDADEISPDDSVCGWSGRCVASDVDAGAYLCSVACGNADADCPIGAFTCGGAPPGLPNVCSI